MFNVRSVTILIYIAFSAHITFSQEKLTLDDVIEKALQNSTKVRSAQIDASLTRNLAYQAISEGLPSLVAKVEYTNNFKIGTSVIEFTDASTGESTVFLAGFGTPHQADVLFEASQLLIDGRYFIGLKARKDIIEGAKLQYEMDEIEIKLSVIKAYYAALAAERSEDLLKRNLETVEEILEETSILYESGFAEELDVDRLKLSRSNLESQIKNAARQRTNAINNLKFQMGLDLSKEIELTQSLVFFAENMEMPDFMIPDPMFRVEYRLLQNQKQLRQYDITQKRAGYFPTLYAFANMGTSAFRDEFDFFTNNDARWFSNGAAGFTLNVPIFDGLRRNASVQESKIKLEQSNNNINQFEQSLQLEVSQAYTDFITAYDNYTNLQENVRLAEKIFNKTTIMYKEGVGSSLSLAEAESDMATAQINYIEAIYDLLVSKSVLDKSQGKL